MKQTAINPILHPTKKRGDVSDDNLDMKGRLISPGQSEENMLNTTANKNDRNYGIRGVKDVGILRSTGLKLRNGGITSLEVLAA